MYHSYFRSVTVENMLTLSGIEKIASAVSWPKLRNVFRLDINAAELRHLTIPGKFITISNRPIGVIEDLIIHFLLSDSGKKHTFLPNGYYQHSIFEDAVPVVAADTLNQALNAENAADTSLCLFPVGDISKFQLPNYASDSKWNKEILEGIHVVNYPIIPIYIKISEDNLSKILGMLHPSLRVRRIVSMIGEGIKLDVSIRIGKPVYRSKLPEMSYPQFGRYLRAKLYSLGTTLDVEKFYPNSLAVQPVIDPIIPELIQMELDSIREENMIGEQGDFEMYLAKAKKIPNTLNEIGRLREITFRKVGEGTAKALDLDEFDLHYLHLFLWDKKRQLIAGAYRIGSGDYIMRVYGKKGFYIRSLFKIGDELNDKLTCAVELGRSFVAEPYQKNRIPLFLLWKGVMQFIRSKPEVRYIMGPVSISNSYSEASRTLLVSYIRKYHWNEEWAAFVRPKKKFTPQLNGLDMDPLLDASAHDCRQMDSLLEDIEPSKLKMPVLLKKYIHQNGRIIAFNVDPEFNDALDGFMVCEISKMPEDWL